MNRPDGQSPRPSIRGVGGFGQSKGKAPGPGEAEIRIRLAFTTLGGS